MTSNDGIQRASLPEREEMERRLIGVFDDPDARQYVYPILLEDAGSKKRGAGILMMFALALYDMPEGAPEDLADRVWEYTGDFIKALVDDEEVQAEALEGLAYTESRI